MTYPSRRRAWLVPLHALIVFAGLSEANPGFARAQQAIISLPSADITPGRKLFGMVESQFRPVAPKPYYNSTTFFCFGLDGVVDLRIDARTLFDHGVRFVKAPASLLLSDSGRAPTEIHPQDLSRLLTRNGIQLIADSIDLEKTVVEALDLDVRFGQGDAFSPPRPMKPELLEPVADQPVTPSAPAANDAPPAETQPKRVSYRSTLRRA